MNPMMSTRFRWIKLTALLFAAGLQGCAAVVVAADVAITGASAVVGATTSVIGGAIDLITPSRDDKK